MQKITKKTCFWGFPSRKFIFRDRNSKLATNVFKRMLLNWEHVALAWLQGIPRCEWFWGENHQKWVFFVISHNLNVILWTIPNSQLNSFGLENYPRSCRYRKWVIFEYFICMLRFGAFYRKMALKLVISGFASGRCNFYSMNSKPATNVLTRMSMIIKCFVLVWNVSDPCCEWFWGKNL